MTKLTPWRVLSRFFKAWEALKSEPGELFKLRDRASSCLFRGVVCARPRSLHRCGPRRCKLL